MDESEVQQQHQSDYDQITPPTCPRCGTKYIQVLDWIRKPRPEARFACHGCDVTYIAYVPDEWRCPAGWLPAFA